MRRVISDYEIQEIYHLASKSIVKTTSNDPFTTYQTNIMGTVALLEACKNSGQKIESIVISTSDKAFGESKVPYKEDSPLKPLYSYDTSKSCQQLISISYSRNYDLPVKVIACGNAYGPGDNNFTRIIPKNIRNLSLGKKATLWKGSEKHTREFVYIDDIIEALILVNKNGENGEVYCCGGNEPIKIDDLLTRLCNIMGKIPSNEIEIVEKPIQFKEIEEQYMNSDKLSSLGWKAKTSLNEGLENAVRYYTKQSQTKPKETIINGVIGLEDGRGKIKNYILDEPINWIGLITTIVKKTDLPVLRANHYHPFQEQKVLVITGSYISLFRPLNEPNGEIEHHLVSAGDLVITPPNLVHAQIFLEDTTLLNLVNGERDVENYGKHTVPHDLINKDDLKKYVKLYV